MIRDFKKASELFLDSIQTFTAKEIISYKELVYYTILTSLISLPRSEIKKKVNLLLLLLLLFFLILH